MVTAGTICSHHYQYKGSQTDDYNIFLFYDMIFDVNKKLIKSIRKTF